MEDVARVIAGLDPGEPLVLGRPVGGAHPVCEMLTEPVPAAVCPAGGGPLITARQASIPQLVAVGQPDRAIGRALGISPRTVQAHLQNVYRALNVTARTEALARLRDLSLTERSLPPVS